MKRVLSALDGGPREKQLILSVKGSPQTVVLLSSSVFTVFIKLL